IEDEEGAGRAEAVEGDEGEVGEGAVGQRRRGDLAVSASQLDPESYRAAPRVHASVDAVDLVSETEAHIVHRGTPVRLGELWSERAIRACEVASKQPQSSGVREVHRSAHR